MTLREPRRDEARAGWLTAAFWVYLVVFAYCLIFISQWWQWLVAIAVGVALAYIWWRNRRHGRYWLLWGIACALLGGVALLGSGRALLATVFVPADSVGHAEIDCGSVVDPNPEHELTVTNAETGEAVVASSPIPQSELARVCSNWLDSRRHDATGVAWVGLLLGVRAAGHLRPRDRGQAKQSDEATQSSAGS